MSEIQPSLGELEDAQNTAYENFFTARDAVTAATLSPAAVTASRAVKKFS